MKVLNFPVQNIPSSDVLDSIRNHKTSEVIRWIDGNQKNIDASLNHLNTTALMAASWHGNTELVIRLLEFGADPTKKNTDNSCVLQFGARHSDIIDLLVKTDARLDINHQDSLGFTPLMQATNILVKDGLFHQSVDLSLVDERIKCIEKIVSMGADVNLRNSFGRTALMSAAHINSVRMVQTLINLGADTDIVCLDGKTATDWADNDDVKKVLEKAKLKIIRHH